MLVEREGGLSRETEGGEVAAGVGLVGTPEEPLDGLVQVLLDATSTVNSSIEDVAERVSGVRVSQLGGLLEPVDGLLAVPLDSVALFEHDGQVVHAVSVSKLCRL